MGLQCPRPAHAPVPPLVGPRSYDADLANQDRIELLIDTDRDYCSVIELAVAENGKTWDRCLGYTSFNPKWYVKVLGEQSQWQAEIAIPIDSLTGHTPRPGDCWAVSARRVRPGEATQSWSQLRTHLRLPVASGLLQFE